MGGEETGSTEGGGIGPGSGAPLDVGEEKGAGVGDESKANAEGRRMSRAAEIIFMIDAVGEQNG